MLYALGSNGSGQLGTGDREDAHVPKKCILPSDFDYSSIVSIAAGGNHTLISTPGQIYATGEVANDRYPIVRKYTESKPENALHFRLSTVATLFCAATWETTIYVDDIQRVFTCGTGHKGELGQGNEIIQSDGSRVLKNFPPSDDDLIVADLAASMSHVVCLFDNGEIYGWGTGRKGQIGLPAVDVWSPRLISGITLDPHRVVCGKDFTIIVGSPSSGQLLVLGSDRWGVVSEAPKSLPPWKDIGASWGSIFVLLESGEVLSWGRNDHGQLAPSGLPKLSQLAVGSEHVVAVTESGAAIAWGWGEHGNCGQDTDEQGDVRGRWNEIRVTGKVVTIGAGCATTFIATLEDS